MTLKNELIRLDITYEKNKSFVTFKPIVWFFEEDR